MWEGVHHGGYVASLPCYPVYPGGHTTPGILASLYTPGYTQPILLFPVLHILLLMVSRGPVRTAWAHLWEKPWGESLSSVLKS